MNAATAIGPDVGNGAERIIQASEPYRAQATIQGVSDLLFHRWNCEAVAEKAHAAKGSGMKKFDDVESYLYRNDSGQICLPGEYLRQAAIHAAKFRQDPRSPRRSAVELYRAGIVCLSNMVPLGPSPSATWDYLHKCRAQVQRAGITRIRPAFRAGWQATVIFACLLPEYIKPVDLHDTLMQAGRLVGVGDFRPTYGRFQVVCFDLVQEGNDE